MTRVKRGTISMKRRRSVLKNTKGYRFGRKSKEREAKVAIRHAGVHAFNHRKAKKGDFRRLWQTKLNAFARMHATSYSKLIALFKEKKVGLDRKILAYLAEHRIETLNRILNK